MHRRTFMKTAAAGSGIRQGYDSWGLNGYGWAAIPSSTCEAPCVPTTR